MKTPGDYILPEACGFKNIRKNLILSPLFVNDKKLLTLKVVGVSSGLLDLTQMNTKRLGL